MKAREGRGEGWRGHQLERRTKSGSMVCMSLQRKERVCSMFSAAGRPPSCSPRSPTMRRERSRTRRRLQPARARGTASSPHQPRPSSGGGRRHDRDTINGLKPYPKQQQNTPAMGLLAPECYVTRTNGSLTAAAQHLRLRLYLRSLRARNRSGFAGSNNGESHLLLHQQLQHHLLTLKGHY